MSDNVIEFPGKKEEEGELLAKNRNEHLNLCKMVLTEEDYRDVLCAIMDQEIYDALEQDIKNIVDTYFSYKF